MSGYALGRTSRSKLAGVHARVVAVVERAIALTAQDFAVTDGVRSIERQKELVAAGRSRTLRSKHLAQPDGYGHAVDLVPWIDGKPTWDLAACAKIADAVRAAARELGVPMVWGAVWDRDLRDIDGDLMAAIEAYRARHPGSDFIDGPHYQLGGPS